MSGTLKTHRDSLKRKHPRYQHWEKFLAIENDLEGISRYVTISVDNYSTYSMQFAAMIMHCCSEIEKLNKRISGAKSRSKFQEFMPQVIRLFPEMPEFQSNFLLWEISFVPWERLRNDSEPPPDWWKSYNYIKHDKVQAERAGNLESCLNAVAALYISTLYYERFLWAYTSENGSQRVLLPHALEPRLVTPYQDFSTDHRTLWGNQFVYEWKDSHAQTAP